MPRTRFPPTPGTSTGPAPVDKDIDMEGAFSLPPAAINRSPPVSPVLQRKRTLSGSAKNKQDLPPPPSRARKIIQMKPKDDASQMNTPAAKTTATATTSPKRKQPSATSAAGRKIARKTAHSIIERRRRSKMNEEFGVLKDMIPACKGVEMHKLAILQAGIEYVRYLQGCVDKLSETNTPIAQHDTRYQQPSASSHTEPVRHQDTFSHSASDDDRRNSFASSAASSAFPSPALQPEDPRSDRADISTLVQDRLLGQRQSQSESNTQPKKYSTSPPPLIVQTPAQSGISPAFNAIHFSPDLNRTMPPGQGQFGSFVAYSPNILPLPQAALAVNEAGSKEGHAEATATAALMMLTNDRRSSTAPSGRGGMSVRDLLSN